MPGAGCFKASVVTVNPIPALITGATSVCIGTTSLLGSSTGGTWSSVTTAVATISAGGLVSGIASGASEIRYTLATGCMRTATVTVGALLTPITGTLTTCIGLNTSLANATTGGTWSSSNSSIAPITASGVVSGHIAGTTNITYSFSAGCRTSVTVTVGAALPAITGTANACVNATSTLSNTVSGGAWSSSNAALGTVDPATGVVTGIASGTPYITYTAGTGCYRAIAFTVKPSPGTISGNTALCVGATSTVTDGTGTSWTSGDPSVATVGITSGVLTGISAGTSIITFTGTTGCKAMKTATVDVAPSVSGITGLSGVAVAHTITLTDVTAGGVWSSSAVAKATVSATGVVTGVATGATTISYTVTNGVCNLSASKAITVSASKDGIDNAVSIETTLYPNPTSGSFNVNAGVAGTLVVHSLEGKEVGVYQLQQGITSVSLPNGIASGVYVCQFRGDDGSVMTIRLVYMPR
jgi:uncharacterized protein YjdB